MSTRAIIHVYDKLDGFNIYIHWDDGLPERVIPSIEIASKYAWSPPRFEASDFIVALIRVLKKRAWWVYLINSTEKLSEADYYYQISANEEWEIRVKTKALNFNHLLHMRGL